MSVFKTLKDYRTDFSEGGKYNFDHSKDVIDIKKLFSKNGLYSSRSRQKWKEWEYVARHAPEGWKEVHMEAEKKDEEVDVIEGEFPAVLPEKKTSTWA